MNYTPGLNLWANKNVFAVGYGEGIDVSTKPKEVYIDESFTYEGLPTYKINVANLDRDRWFGVASGYPTGPLPVGTNFVARLKYFVKDKSTINAASGATTCICFDVKDRLSKVSLKSVYINLESIVEGEWTTLFLKGTVNVENKGLVLRLTIPRNGEVYIAPDVQMIIGETLTPYTLSPIDTTTTGRVIESDFFIV